MHSRKKVASFIHRYLNIIRTATYIILQCIRVCVRRKGKKAKRRAHRELPIVTSRINNFIRVSVRSTYKSYFSFFSAAHPVCMAL